MKHKAGVGFISRTQKTAKTECGKIVVVSKIAVGCDTDCPECRAAVNKIWATVREIASNPLVSETTRRAATRGEPRKYQTVYFL